jgi:hypothetical protein
MSATMSAVLARLQWLVNANLTSGRPGSRQKYVMVCASHLLGELIDNLYRGS